jgi:hypothetical protein
MVPRPRTDTLLARREGHRCLDQWDTRSGVRTPELDAPQRGDTPRTGPTDHPEARVVRDIG